MRTIVPAFQASGLGRSDGIDVACARSLRGTKNRIRSDTRFFWQPERFAKMHPYIAIPEGKYALSDLPQYCAKKS